jgi:hypothetical protein
MDINTNEINNVTFSRHSCEPTSRRSGAMSRREGGSRNPIKWITACSGMTKRQALEKEFRELQKYGNIYLSAFVIK